MLEGTAAQVVLTSPELCTLVASFDAGPLSLRRYRGVCRSLRELTRSSALLKCLTSAEACVAYRVGSSVRLYSRAWDGFLVSRRRAASLSGEVGRAVSVGRYRFYFEWLERDSESIAIWDLVDWWRITVSRTEPCENHVARGGATCVAGELVYLCGGSSSTGATLDSIYVLDTRRLDRGWQRTAMSLPRATSDASCELVGRELVVLGGCARAAETVGWRAVSCAQYVHLDTGATRVVDLPNEFHRCCAASCVSTADGSIVVAGGGPASRWEALQQQQQQRDEPRQQPDALSQCAYVVAYHPVTHACKSLDFPFVVRDKPSIVCLPDGALLVAGTIAKQIDARIAGALGRRRRLRPATAHALRRRFLASAARARRSRRLHTPPSSLPAPQDARRILPPPPKADALHDAVVSDLAVLDLALVYQHLFQPDPKPHNHLLPATKDLLPFSTISPTPRPNRATSGGTPSGPRDESSSAIYLSAACGLTPIPIFFFFFFFFFSFFFMLRVVASPPAAPTDHNSARLLSLHPYLRPSCSLSFPPSRKGPGPGESSH